MDTAISASTFLIPRGEVAMIVAGYGVAIGACPPEFLSIGALIMIITTLVTIFFIRLENSENMRIKTLRNPLKRIKKK